MKKLTIAVLLTVGTILSFARCGDGEAVEEPVVPLTLNKNRVLLDSVRRVDKIHIDSGNGGYHIVYPRFTNAFTLIETGELIGIEYSEDILHLHIDSDNNIVIERRSRYEDDIFGYFIVRDARGERQIFGVGTSKWFGGWYDIQYLAREAQIIEFLYDDPDYWQE